MRPAQNGDGAEKILFIASWAGILLGFLSGGAMGLRFYGPEWFGGYASWPRRMLRLGHVSLVALPLLNFASVFFLRDSRLVGNSVNVLLALLLAGQVSMPLVCFLSAWDPRFRYLFPVPVVSLITAAAGGYAPLATRYVSCAMPSSTGMWRRGAPPLQNSKTVAGSW